MFLDSPKDFSPISLLIHYSHVILFFTSNEYFFDFHNSLLMEGEDKSTHKDYYKVLEVEYDATDEKIRLNYRKLALKWHPDKHGGDSAVTEKFQEINEAYKEFLLICECKIKAFEISVLAEINNHSFVGTSISSVQYVKR
ncbi:uncharacterized protein LOC111388338 isoform X3 [Olea europaea var. sylvestris]|uniref:uncharacterized protein LOC111388338 isoform X3 n=1 Tax=Olea europaea var. sylvestris TaxID=158386 RepID=UPI000C1D7FEE|nr:uncharacterized protein LOC111388338 isoform X3 [Olea europaea var. sylvestris]